MNLLIIFKYKYFHKYIYKVKSFYSLTFTDHGKESLYSYIIHCTSKKFYKKTYAFYCS